MIVRHVLMLLSDGDAGLIFIAQLICANSNNNPVSCPQTSTYFDSDSVPVVDTAIYCSNCLYFVNMLLVGISNCSIGNSSVGRSISTGQFVA